MFQCLGARSQAFVRNTPRRARRARRRDPGLATPPRLEIDGHLHALHSGTSPRARGAESRLVKRPASTYARALRPASASSPHTRSAARPIWDGRRYARRISSCATPAMRGRAPIWRIWSQAQHLRGRPFASCRKGRLRQAGLIGRPDEREPVRVADQSLDLRPQGGRVL